MKQNDNANVDQGHNKHDVGRPITQAVSTRLFYISPIFFCGFSGTYTSRPPESSLKPNWRVPPAVEARVVPAVEGLPLVRLVWKEKRNTRQSRVGTSKVAGREEVPHRGGLLSSRVEHTVGVQERSSLLRIHQPRKQNKGDVSMRTAREETHTTHHHNDAKERISSSIQMCPRE